jgi:asparagine synthase (glutamine-hydrolysing)
MLSHRGPDGTGGLSEDLSWAHVSLEMARLSIVDRTAIPVPFDFRASCGVVLAFNGEVYNWRALRAELSDGLPWATECDAEVVARGWRRWGLGVLQRLNGMFGLVLVDTLKGVVLLARDRAGEKPLYYAPLGSGIAFASEIKALPVKLEEAPCAELEALEFDCLETTPFRGVRCLGPGEYILFAGTATLGAPQPARWWSLPTDIDEGMSWDEAIEQTESLLVDSIRLRAVTEVPVAVQISGGLDSAIIQAVAKSDRLYTATFPEDGVDNLALARAAAQGREPAAITFGFADLDRVLSKVAYHLDTPATWTAVCQWFMDQKIAEDGAVVVLSGEGADELFGGYSRYRILWWLDQAIEDENLSAYGALYRSMFGKSDEILARMLNRGGEATLDHARSIAQRFAGTCCDLPAAMMRVDFYTTMQVLLRMADRMAAAFGMENRSPFLDHRLIELGARMPTRWKINERESKAVLREVARRLGVPSAIVDEKTKRGLFVPWGKWCSSVGEGAARGAWDRGVFTKMMRTAWRRAFDLM